MALHIAAAKGYDNIVALLTNHNAYVNIRNDVRLFIININNNNYYIIL